MNSHPLNGQEWIVGTFGAHKLTHSSNQKGCKLASSQNDWKSPYLKHPVIQPIYAQVQKLSPFCYFDLNIPFKTALLYILWIAASIIGQIRSESGQFVIQYVLLLTWFFGREQVKPTSLSDLVSDLDS